MGWDIYIETTPDGEGEVMVLPERPVLASSVQCIGGEPLAEMSITFNYVKFFHEALPEGHKIRELDHKKVSDTLEGLKEGLAKLKVAASWESDFAKYESNDYWFASATNAARALESLITMGELCPNGYWMVN
jgi:hypothetical protein